VSLWIQCRSPPVYLCESIKQREFKWVNDTLGHSAGDALLKMIAGRILAASRQSELLILQKFEAARIGGDEFIVLYQLGSENRSQATTIAHRIFDAVSQEMQLSGKPYQPKVSVCVALSPTHSTDMRELIMLADSAMYRAKSSGENRVVLHS